jgi:hypothetical protein
MKNENEEDISFVIKKIKRPIAVTILCLISFLALLISIIHNPLFSNGDYDLTPYIGFISLLKVVCIIGLWKMKKWALYIYASMFLVNQFMLIYLNHWTFDSIVIPPLFIGIALYYLNKME